MSRSYNVDRYVLVKNGKLFDTSFIFPHVECYFIEDCKLYCENIDGTEMYLGQIVAKSNSLSDIEGVVDNG